MKEIKAGYTDSSQKNVKPIHDYKCNVQCNVKYYINTSLWLITLYISKDFFCFRQNLAKK